MDTAVKRVPAPAGKTPSFLAYSNLIVVTVGFTLTFWAWNLIAPMSGEYQQRLGLSSFQQSFLVAAPMLVGSLGRIPVGALTDKYGARLMFPLVSALTVVPPLSGVELRLVEEEGTVLADHASIGEIQVRGPNLFTGYLNRPDATAAAFTEDGWFRTGDVATVDPDGCVRIVGRRATDLIKSGGYKIGAGEIENALLAHPGVCEAAVTGEPDEDLGERVVAWVVPAEPGSPPTTRELADHVAAQLAPHKRPRTVRFLDVLPRNDLGKIMKRSLGV